MIKILLLLFIILTNINCVKDNIKSDYIKDIFNLLSDKKDKVDTKIRKQFYLNRNLKLNQEINLENKRVNDDSNLRRLKKNDGSIMHNDEEIKIEDKYIIEQNRILRSDQLNLVYDTPSNMRVLDSDGQIVETSEMLKNENNHLLCSSSIKKKKLLLVSTIDGQLTAMDYESGKVVWTYSLGNKQSSLISSTLSKVGINTNGEWMRLIPSLDGAIYKYDGENITPLPVNADILLHSSYRFNDDTVITGGKTFEVVGIDPVTGEVKYSCSKDGCERSTTTKDTPLVVLTKESKTVRAVDLRSGEERWNFRVGQHFLQVAQKDYADLHEYSEGKVQNLLFIIPEGILKAEGDSGHLWTQKMPSPIVSAWKVTEREAIQLDLFSNTTVPALVSESSASSTDSSASLYIGYHKDEFYVQESLSFKNKVTSYSRDIPSNKYAENLPKLKWRPYLATSDTRTPVLSHMNKNPDLMIDYERKKLGDDTDKDKTYLAENGYYLFDDEEKEVPSRKNLPFAFLYRKNKSFREFCTINNLDFIFEKFENKFFNLWTLVGLLLIGFASCTCTCCWFRLQTIRTLIMLIISWFFNTIFRLLQRAGVDINIQPTNTNSYKDNQSEVSSGRISEPYDRRISETSDTTAQIFTSRLCSEFTAIACLGKGGFGYVFNAQHKVDATNYAIKRIRLPTRESSKVMREVYALAKLQHPYIVRYFSSWIEMPPIDWKSPFDALVSNSDASFDPDNWEESESVSRIGTSFLSGDDNRPTSNQFTLESSQSTDVNYFNSLALNCRRNSLTKDDDSSSIIFEDTSDTQCTSEGVSYSVAVDKSESRQITNSFDLEPDLKSDGTSVRKTSRRKSETENQRIYLYIQMELCKQKTLGEWLQENTIRDRRKILHTFNNIVHAVEYIHDQGLIHRDLKPSNIFFSNDGNVKVGDFGLVTSIADEVSQKMTEESNIMGKRTVKAGTELYMSPEQKEKRRYNHKVDMFSLGIIFYEMLVPFGTEMERRLTLMKVRQRDFSDQFQKIFQEECLVLHRALNKDADLRPTTRGLRYLQPLARLQTDLHEIDEEEHLVLRTISHRKRLNSNNEHIILI